MLKGVPSLSLSSASRQFGLAVCDAKKLGHVYLKMPSNFVRK